MSPRATPTNNMTTSTSSSDFSLLLKILTGCRQQQQQQQQQQSQKRKRVRFSAELASTAPTSDITEDELKSMWYDNQTLNTFKNQVRKLVLSGNLQSHLDDNDGTADDDDEESSSSSSTTRGLESCSLERQLRRHRAVKCVLSAQQQGYTAEQTAQMAEQCGAWSRDVALLRACHDFFEAHQPSMPLERICNTPPATFPFEMEMMKQNNNNNNKRCQSQVSGEGRRVRRRTIV